MNRNLTANGVSHLNTGIVIGNVQSHLAQQQQQQQQHQHQHHLQQPQPPSLNGSTNSSLSSTPGGGSSSGHSSLDNLPKKFVSSMRTLFDIMDDKRTGFVRLVDIEARWQDDGSKGLPHGVIDCLRRVTPVSGMLSFERFCAGLKICLLRNQTSDGGSKSSRRSSTDSNGNLLIVSSKLAKESKPPRPPSAPLLDLDAITTNVHHWNATNTAAVRPNNALPVQRTLSLPKLSPSSDGESSNERYIVPSMYAPPKPPRTALLLGNGTTNINHLDRFDKAEIRHALQNWQMGVLMNEMDAKDKRRAMALPSNGNGSPIISNHISRGSADGSPNILFQHPSQQQQQQPPSHSSPPPPPLPASSSQAQHPLAPTISIPQQTQTLLEFQKKSTTNRRREPRRHTLQNGIDYNMLKRLRYLEEEKDMLLDGLNAVEKAQEWYFKQIAHVQEKMKYLGRGDTHLEQWSEAHQERLDLQRARIMEVNRYLASLADSWERGGFPMHMNLAVRNLHHNNNNNNNNINNNNNNNNNNNSNSVNSNNNNQYGSINGNGNAVAGEPSSFHNNVQVNRLKLQNRQLTEEVSQKSERITALEVERKALFRELVQHQQHQQQLQQQLLRKQGHIICGNEEVIF